MPNALPSRVARLAAALISFIVAGSLFAQDGARKAPRVVFIGNSFFYAAGSPVHFYRANTVTDLNGEGIGGMPALFKAFATQAGLDFDVSLETSGGKNFDWHLENKADVIGRPWDIVVAAGYSTLDQKNPGNPTLLVQTAKQLAELMHSKNSAVDLRLVATWSRADQTYPETGHWHGQPIEKMALDVRAAYDSAAANTPFIHDVIPVGEAFNRAMKAGVADPNPYDGISFGQIDLWTTDHYHASTYGYYLEALMVFGDVTGLDPRSLGKDERTAFELGMSAPQAEALQKIAFEELAATKGRAPLKTFKPVPLPR